MSTQNRQVIRDLYEALSEGNIDAVLDFMTEDVTWHAPGAAPYSGRRTGREGVRSYFNEWMRLVRMDEFDVDDLVADGDKVVALGRERDTVKDTDQHFEFEWAHVYKLRNGKVESVRIYSDTNAEAAAFGESAKERQATSGPMGVTHEAYSGRSSE